MVILACSLAPDARAVIEERGDSKRPQAINSLIIVLFLISDKLKGYCSYLINECAIVLIREMKGLLVLSEKLIYLRN